MLTSNAISPQSAADRTAELLRTAIIQGELRPGMQLPEEQFAEALSVSRNTLREAFRLLIHDGLLVHHMHSGVFVRVLDVDDLKDLYWVRRTVEGAVVRALRDQSPDTEKLRADVLAAEAAARRGSWQEVGTANMEFHLHLMALAGSRLVSEISRRLMAEMRLGFQRLNDQRSLHEPFVEWNRSLLAKIESGDAVGAAAELDNYLVHSEDRLLVAYRRGLSRR